MKFRPFDVLPADQREKLDEEVDALLLIAGIGQTIKQFRDESNRLEALLVKAGGEKLVEAPEGFLFGVRGFPEDFRIQKWRPRIDYVDAGWEAISIEGRVYGNRRPFFVANRIVTGNVYHTEHPAAAYAMSPGGQYRCRLEGDLTVELVDVIAIPDVVINQSDIVTQG